MSKNNITFSTLFTFLRIVLTPCIAIAMYKHAWSVAFLLFIIAALTDALDGFFARLFNQQTYLGAVLDPLADKFLLITCFSMLAFVESPLFSIPKWFVLFVVVKEIALVMGALGIYKKVGFLPIKPTWTSKVTTVVQMVFIVWIFSCYFFNWVPVKTYYLMLGLLFCMVSITFVQYVYIGYRHLCHDVL